MIRGPPRSTRTDTLFPSTTLFRALRVLAGVVVVATVIGAIAVMGSPGEQRKLRIDEHRINDLRAIEAAVRLHRKDTGSLPEDLATLDARPGVADRKSTRLNSSH